MTRQRGGQATVTDGLPATILKHKGHFSWSHKLPEMSSFAPISGPQWCIFFTRDLTPG
jgi:hypothetical protein